MKRKFSLVMSAAMILSLIAPMTNALAEDIQTPETATPETVVTEDAASGGTTILQSVMTPTREPRPKRLGKASTK